MTEQLALWWTYSGITVLSCKLQVDQGSRARARKACSAQGTAGGCNSKKCFCLYWVFPQEGLCWYNMLTRVSRPPPSFFNCWAFGPCCLHIVQKAEHEEGTRFSVCSSISPQAPRRGSSLCCCAWKSSPDGFLHWRQSRELQIFSGVFPLPCYHLPVV